MNYLANTNGQDLLEHLLAVGVLSEYLCEYIYGMKSGSEASSDCFIAGVLHDIGKIDDGYQVWCKNKINTNNGEISEHHNEDKEKTFESITRHNELSWALVCLCCPCNARIEYTVLWHHAKKHRQRQSKNLESILAGFHTQYLNNIEKEKIDDFFIALNKQRQCINFDHKKLNDDVRDCPLLNFKKGNQNKYDFDQNYNNSRVRDCVIIADRIVSSLPANQLKPVINGDETTWNQLIQDFKNR